MTTTLKSLLLRLFVLLAFYSAFRGLFFLFNLKTFANFPASVILESFLNGLRFDIAAIAIINAPLILLSSLPGRFKFQRWFQIKLSVLVLALNLPFLAANIADMEFYKFSGTRMTWDILLFRGDAGHQADQILVHYWYLAIVLLITIVVLFQFEKRHRHAHYRTTTYPSLKKEFLIAPLLLVFLIIGVRGGLGKKVLKPVHAFQSGSTDLGILTLNSTFTVVKSPLQPVLRKTHFFPTDADAKAALPPTHFNFQKTKTNENVVIIILESFAAEFWGATNKIESYTPFLDELSQKGHLFKNNFANGRRSIDGLPAVLFAVPTLMDTPVFKSAYQNNRWRGLGEILSDNGYHTSFFHGAPKGTMYFDAISSVGGLKDYYPLERYPQKTGADYDGNWGIFDEPMLQLAATELTKHPTPFFSVAFTISSHQPYTVPPQYKEQLPKGTMEIHQSIAYVDYSVRQFFKTAEKQPWFKNTLFIITGDHTQMSQAKYFQSSLGRYRVPLLLYHPTKDLKFLDTERITQHVDILPSVLDYLGIHEENVAPFGHSFFDKNVAGRALFHGNGHYWLVQNDHFIEFFEGRETKLFSFSSQDVDFQPLTVGTGDTTLERREALEKELKAYIQLFRNGLIENTLFRPTAHASSATSKHDATETNIKNAHNAVKTNVTDKPAAN